MLLFPQILLQVYELIIDVFMCVAAVAAVEGDLFTQEDIQELSICHTMALYTVFMHIKIVFITIN